MSLSCKFLSPKQGEAGLAEAWNSNGNTTWTIVTYFLGGGGASSNDSLLFGDEFWRWVACPQLCATGVLLGCPDSNRKVFTATNPPAAVGKAVSLVKLLHEKGCSAAPFLGTGRCPSSLVVKVKLPGDFKELLKDCLATSILFPDYFYFLSTDLWLTNTAKIMTDKLEHRKCQLKISLDWWHRHNSPSVIPSWVDKTAFL